MIDKNSELVLLLKAFSLDEIGLAGVRDEMYLMLQDFASRANDSEMQLLSEVLACIYEVEDGVMDEDLFRQAVRSFLAREQSAAIFRQPARTQSA